MRNHPTNTPVHARPPMVCPSWCTEPGDHGIWPLAGGDVFRHHHGQALSPVDSAPVEVAAELCQLWHADEGMCDCVPVLRISGVDPEHALTANDARWLAYALLSTADRLDATERRTARPELLPGPLDRWGRGVGTIVCIDCGSEFHPDSTPHLDRCWVCAELADIADGAQL